MSATSATTLLLAMPGLLLSLLVICLLGLLVSTIAGSEIWLYVIVVGWLISGLVAMWRPVEEIVAVVVRRLRRPTLTEEQRFDIAWGAVTRAAGMSKDSFGVWVEEVEEIKIAAVGRHMVVVTRMALRLPLWRLEAVLARELGHHLAGRTAAIFLSRWYVLPGRSIPAALRPLLEVGLERLATDAHQTARTLGGIALVSVAVPVAAAYPPGFSLFALPFLLAWLSRRAELHADRVAAKLGYGPALSELLYDQLEHGDDVKRRAASRRARALATYPPVATRIRALEIYLRDVEPGR